MFLNVNRKQDRASGRKFLKFFGRKRVGGTELEREKREAVSRKRKEGKRRKTKKKEKERKKVRRKRI